MVPWKLSLARFTRLCSWGVLPLERCSPHVREHFNTSAAPGQLLHLLSRHAAWPALSLEAQEREARGFTPPPPSRMLALWSCGQAPVRLPCWASAPHLSCSPRFLHTFASQVSPAGHPRPFPPTRPGLFSIPAPSSVSGRGLGPRPRPHFPRTAACHVGGRGSGQVVAPAPTTLSGGPPCVAASCGAPDPEPRPQQHPSSRGQHLPRTVGGVSLNPSEGKAR